MHLVTISKEEKALNFAQQMDQLQG